MSPGEEVEAFGALVIVLGVHWPVPVLYAKIWPFVVGAVLLTGTPWIPATVGAAIVPDKSWLSVVPSWTAELAAFNED
jgi:hypothetical protein